jgi:hypothetical protein
VIILSIKETILQLVEDRVQAHVGNHRVELETEELDLINRKKEQCRKRNSEIVKCRAEGQVIGKNQVDNKLYINYLVHYQFLINQNERLYLEEMCEERRAIFESGQLVSDQEIQKQEEDIHEVLERDGGTSDSRGFKYNRLEAVRYAERWWNSYNPNYKKFENDCTNYISQCLHAGGAPMTGYPNRSKGWWMRSNNWSFTWSVAHSFRWYLSGAKSGLRAKEVSSPQELLLGDIICYDFEGDGRFNHNTIVVAKDENNMPLVNAHTTNSRMRYWEYTDSTAYTPNIKYKFFTIIDD